MISAAKVEADLAEYVAMLKKEHRRISRILERMTRYAPPHGAHLRACIKVERELIAVEKQMSRIERITKRLPQGDSSHV